MSKRHFSLLGGQLCVAYGDRWYRNIVYIFALDTIIYWTRDLSGYIRNADPSKIPHPLLFMMTSSNSTFSALLALCAGNSLVTSEFPSQRTVSRSFDVFFDLRQNKRLNKQSWGWWFETPNDVKWRQMTGISTVYSTDCSVLQQPNQHLHGSLFARGIHQLPKDYPTKGPVIRSFLWCGQERALKQTVELPVIWDAMLHVLSM